MIAVSHLAETLVDIGKWEFKFYTFKEMTDRFSEIVNDVVFKHSMNVLCISFNTKLIF